MSSPDPDPDRWNRTASIELYPAKSFLIRGALIGAVYVSFGYSMLGAAEGRDGVFWFSILMIVGFGLLLGSCILGLVRPRPSFQADANGFSVMGKKTRPWSDYYGTSTSGISIYFIRILRWPVIKTGNGFLAKKLQIRWTHQSSKARIMAQEIDSFAARYR